MLSNGLTTAASLREFIQVSMLVIFLNWHKIAPACVAVMVRIGQ